jgi:hypothetical protein
MRLSGMRSDDCGSLSMKPNDPRTITDRNPRTFIGHESTNGFTRRVAGRGQPHRPSSSHLALGRGEPKLGRGKLKHKSLFEEEEENDNNEDNDDRAKAKARRAYVAQRADDLERLLLRKISSKQPVSYRSEHALHGCDACTKAGRGEKNKPLEPEGKYFHQKQKYRHTHWPHPPVLIRGQQSGGRARPKVR